MKQRYIQKDKEYKAYTDYLMRYKVASKILNNQDTIANVDSKFWDKENIQIELLIRIGDQHGKYFRGGGEMTAEIPFFEHRLKEVESQFLRYKQARFNQGYPEPKEYPSHILEDKLKIEAKLDVINLEIENLTKRLKELKVEEEKSEEQCLEVGAVGSGKFWGTRAVNPDLINVLKVMDGQKIGQTSSGLLIIKDERSPYNGMAVCDYRGFIVNQFIADRKKLDRERLRVLKAKAKEEGLPIPHQTPARGPVKISKSSLPAWPEGIRNYIAEPEEDSSSSSSSMKRTKSK